MVAALAHAVADAAARHDAALRSEVSALAAALAAASEPLRDALSADLARRAAAAPYGEDATGGLLSALAPLLALQPRNTPLGTEPDAVVAACAAALRSPRCETSCGALLITDAKHSIQGGCCIERRIATGSGCGKRCARTACAAAAAAAVGRGVAFPALHAAAALSTECVPFWEAAWYPRLDAHSIRSQQSSLRSRARVCWAWTAAPRQAPRLRWWWPSTLLCCRLT